MDWSIELRVEFVVRSLPCSVFVFPKFVVCFLLEKMADGVDIDLYADDLEQDFAQVSLVIYTY